MVIRLCPVDTANVHPRNIRPGLRGGGERGLLEPAGLNRLKAALQPGDCVKVEDVTRSCSFPCFFLTPQDPARIWRSAYPALRAHGAAPPGLPNGAVPSGPAAGGRDRKTA